MCFLLLTKANITSNCISFLDTNAQVIAICLFPDLLNMLKSIFILRIRPCLSVHWLPFFLCHLSSVNSLQAEDYRLKRSDIVHGSTWGASFFLEGWPIGFSVFASLFFKLLTIWIYILKNPLTFSTMQDTAHCATPQGRAQPPKKYVKLC